MSRLLVYLPALACPLLMLVCMASMRRMGHTPTQTQQSPPAGDTAERIAHLEQELAALRAQQQPTDAPPAPATPAPAHPNGGPPSSRAGRVS
jgi:hypothetical protein